MNNEELSILDNPETRSDVQIFLDGEMVEDLKDLRGEDATPYLTAVHLAVSFGYEVEVRLSNRELLAAALAEGVRPGLTVTAIA